jgi:hypothetical protein
MNFALEKSVLWIQFNRDKRKKEKKEFDDTKVFEGFGK